MWCIGRPRLARRLLLRLVIVFSLNRCVMKIVVVVRSRASAPPLCVRSHAHPWRRPGGHRNRPGIVMMPRLRTILEDPEADRRGARAPGSARQASEAMMPWQRSGRVERQRPEWQPGSPSSKRSARDRDVRMDTVVPAACRSPRFAPGRGHAHVQRRCRASPVEAIDPNRLAGGAPKMATLESTVQPIWIP